jgi:hypothetical protein
MKVSRLKIVYSTFNVVLFVSVLFIGLTASQAPPYNPWLDVNDDGYGGIDDIVSTAEHFGASGSPAKLCNITNWPSQINVTILGYMFRNESFRKNLPPKDAWGIYLDTQGYREISIGFWTTASTPLEVWIWWQIGDTLRGYVEESFSFSNADSQLKVYGVHGSMLGIEIYNPSTTATSTVDVEYYLTA